MLYLDFSHKEDKLMKALDLKLWCLLVYSTKQGKLVWDSYAHFKGHRNAFNTNETVAPSLRAQLKQLKQNER